MKRDGILFYSLLLGGVMVLLTTLLFLSRKWPPLVPLILLTVIIVAAAVVFSPRFSTLNKKAKYDIVIACLGFAFFTHLLSYDKYSLVESSICDLFFAGHVYSREVETMTDEGVPETDTRYFFKPAGKSAKLGQQFVDFALIEVGFCSLLMPLYLIRKTGYSDKE